MAQQPEKNRAKWLCIDIETARQDRLRLREIGAYRPDTDTRLRISGKAADLTQKLDKVTEGVAFVLGHNAIAFDQPALSLLHPDLALHRLPLVDTMERKYPQICHVPIHDEQQEVQLISGPRRKLSPLQSGPSRNE